MNQNKSKRNLRVCKKRSFDPFRNYFSGTYADDFVAPIPRLPCLTGRFVTENRECLYSGSVREMAGLSNNIKWSV